MEIKDAVLQAINEVGLSLHIGEADEVVKLVEEKLTSTKKQSTPLVCSVCGSIGDTFNKVVIICSRCAG